MPIVTDTLLAILRAQIQAHGTVVWYDEDEVYAACVADLGAAKVGAASIGAASIGAEAIHSYTPERGFLHLRHVLEPLWGQSETAPRVLIYVPMAQTATDYALIEYEKGGVVLRPHQQPPERNTDLAYVARQALDSVFPPARREEIVAQVAEGKLSLDELDDLAEKGAQAGQGALSVIFGTDHPAEIALRFLALPELDEELEARQAGDDLVRLLQGLLGIAFSPDHGIDGLRAQVARRVLLTDFIVALGDHVPASLTSVDLAEQPVAREAAVALVETWRSRRDLVSSYRQWAARTATEIGVGSLTLDLEGLFRSTTFLTVEQKLQQAVEAQLTERATQALLDRVQARQATFWPQVDPLVKMRWDVIIDAAQVLLGAGRIQSALKRGNWPAESLVSRYAYEEQEDAWCFVDSVQRRLERDYHTFELDPQQHDSLIQLVARARQVYAEAVNRLTQTFIDAYEQAAFHLPNVLQQADVYRDVVEPERVRHQRVAYVLVDALRFEMARELSQEHLKDQRDWEVDLRAALATPPTVTDVGMTALLPGAERGLALSHSKNRLTPSLAESSEGTFYLRERRVAYVAKLVEGTFVEAKLQELAPLTDVHLSESLQDAELALITSTEDIDGLCESNPTVARRVLDEVFVQLRRALKTLFKRGFQSVVVTADHGYLFGEGLIAGEPTDPPGGKTALLKRRVWVGKGGAELSGFLRTPLSALGLTSDLELVTPRNLAVFKVRGGSKLYFHGGLSLQEVLIPVLTVRAEKQAEPALGGDVTWTLTPGSAAITTRFYSVTIGGTRTQLLPMEPPLVRVEVRADDTLISTPVSATYGFNKATKDVQLKTQPEDAYALAEDTVTLMITEEPDVATADVYLLDAETGVTLANLDDIPLNITL